jgi:hypothetical protein
MAKLWSSLGLVGVVLAGAILSQTSAGQALMRGMGLAGAPAGYAELSFARPQSLPAKLPGRHATLRVPFQIRNTAQSQRTYQWSVDVVRDGTARRAAAGHVQIRRGGTASVTPAVTLTCSGGRVQIAVGLASPHESIDFWANCAPRATASPSPGTTVSPSQGASP